MEGLFLFIIGIGVIVAGVAGIAALIVGWWFIIPLVCALCLGWIGFFFGLGLVAIIGLLILGIKRD